MWREEFPPFTGLAHVIDDLRNEFLVLLFGVLSIKNAVFLMPKSDASEAVLAGDAAVAVAQIIAEEGVAAEGEIDGAARDR